MQKEIYINKIRNALANEPEIERIVLFGSFVNSDHPNDIDIAVFQDSDQAYLQLSMKYRKLVREISKTFSIDIIPIKSGTQSGFLDEILDGEIIYER